MSEARTAGRTSKERLELEILALSMVMMMTMMMMAREKGLDVQKTHCSSRGTKVNTQHPGKEAQNYL